MVVGQGMQRTKYRKEFYKSGTGQRAVLAWEKLDLRIMELLANAPPHEIGFGPIQEYQLDRRQGVRVQRQNRNRYPPMKIPFGRNGCMPPQEGI